MHSLACLPQKNHGAINLPSLFSLDKRPSCLLLPSCHSAQTAGQSLPPYFPPVPSSHSQLLISFSITYIQNFWITYIQNFWNPVGIPTEKQTNVISGCHAFQRSDVPGTNFKRGTIFTFCPTVPSLWRKHGCLINTARSHVTSHYYANG